MGLESFINGAGLASKALDYVDTAVQYFNQKKLNRQAQKDTQQNMQLQKDLNLQQQIDSYRGAVVGMRAAGINPAVAVSGVNMAQGVSSHPGSSGAAAKPENSLPAALEAGKSLAQQESQIANIEQNTQLQKEETREKKIQNDRKESEDYFYTQHFPDFVAHIEKLTDDDEFTRGWLDSVREESKGLLMDKGIVDAFNNIFFEMTRQERFKALDELTNEMDIRVMRMQLNNGTAAALADLPKANRKLIYKNMLKMDAEIAKFRAETGNVAEDTAFFKERREQTAATVAKLGQETLAILHNDKVALYDAGEIGALGLTLGFDAVEQFAHGAGFGTGLAVAGKLAGASGAAKAGTLAKPSFESPKPIVSQPYGKPVPKEILESIREATHATANGNKVYEAQLFNAAVKRWKAQNGYK